MTVTKSPWVKRTSGGGSSSANVNTPTPGTRELEDIQNEFEAGEIRGSQNATALGAKIKKLADKKNLVERFLDKAKNKLNATLQRSGFKPINFKKNAQMAYGKMMSPLTNSKNPKNPSGTKRKSITRCSFSRPDEKRGNIRSKNAGYG